MWTVTVTFNIVARPAEHMRGVKLIQMSFLLRPRRDQAGCFGRSRMVERGSVYCLRPGKTQSIPATTRLSERLLLPLLLDSLRGVIGVRATADRRLGGQEL